MQQPCYFWRGMKTHFSSLLMMLISSHSPNMQMKCAITNEWIAPRRWGRFKQDGLFAKHNFGDLLHFGCVHEATAPGAVWAAAWAGISERCHRNRSSGLQMSLRKSKGEFILLPASLNRIISGKLRQDHYQPLWRRSASVVGLFTPQDSTSY